MLVFWRGAWHDVVLPPYMDPSWGVTEQTRLAIALLKGRAAGRADDSVLQKVETLVSGKQHNTPQDSKEKA